MFTEDDKVLLTQKGMSEADILRQLDCFRNGFPYLELEAAASVDNGGILRLDESAQSRYIKAWEAYKADEHKVVKFVPASGAASRMFKQLFEFLDSGKQVPDTDFCLKFFRQITDFAFFDELDQICRKQAGKGVSELLLSGDYQTPVRLLLNAEGLNYGALPKGLLKFHQYADGARTPLEEHLVEGALYAAGKTSEVNLHFTVSPEHRPLFEEIVKAKLSKYEQKYGLKYHVEFSEQKASTDTIAATSDNTPFRENGQLVFRPGGHGALIANLNEIDADIVFVKNIDNVVPDRLKGDTVTYKQLLAGVLVSLQERAFGYLRLVETGKYTQAQVEEMIRFVQRELCCRNPELKHLEDAELIVYLTKILNRPMRVCGMVRNVGEPGGGPFLAYNSDGTISLQILESSQIDMNDARKREMFEKGTHFNPVDLVCAVRDYNGKPFNLPDYVDPQTGFISLKSKNGKELKALELPGLWNGAMSHWNTVFVEVPLSTFNPVKTVNDLLRPEHQS